MRNISMNKIMAVLLFALVLGIPFAMAATEYVKTTISYDIGANEELTVTLLGPTSEASATGAGASLAHNIEWNLTAGNSGSKFWSNATVGGGAGSVQTMSSPILQLDNTGNRNLNVTMNISSAVDSCMKLYGNTTAQGTNATIAASKNLGGALGWIVDPSFTPAEAATDIYLYMNFSSCTYDNTGTKTLFIKSIGV